jgi:hypothetical protein
MLQAQQHAAHATAPSQQPPVFADQHAHTYNSEQENTAGVAARDVFRGPREISTGARERGQAGGGGGMCGGGGSRGSRMLDDQGESGMDEEERVSGSGWRGEGGQGVTLWGGGQGKRQGVSEKSDEALG